MIITGSASPMTAGGTISPQVWISRASKIKQCRLGWIRQANSNAFMREQPAFSMQTAAIAGQRAIGADHPMAGYDKADRVGAIGQSDRPDRGGPADTRGLLRIAGGFTSRDLPQRCPGELLEVGAAGLHLDSIDSIELAGEIGFK